MASSAAAEFDQSPIVNTGDSPTTGGMSPPSSHAPAPTRLAKQETWEETLLVNGGLSDVPDDEQAPSTPNLRQANTSSGAQTSHQNKGEPSKPASTTRGLESASSQASATLPQDEEDLAAVSVAPVVKRGRGRPRKQVDPSRVKKPVGPKRGVGRPRKHPRKDELEAPAAAGATADDSQALIRTTTDDAPALDPDLVVPDDSQALIEPTTDDAPALDLDNDGDTIMSDGGEEYEHPGDNRVIEAIEAYFNTPGHFYQGVNEDMTLTQHVKVYEIAYQINVLNLKDDVIDAVGQWIERSSHGANWGGFCREILQGLQMVLESRHVVPVVDQYDHRNPFRPETDRLQLLLTHTAHAHMNELRTYQGWWRLSILGPEGREFEKMAERRELRRTALIQCPDCFEMYPRGSLSRCRACNAGPGPWLSATIGQYIDGRQPDEKARDTTNVRYLVKCPGAHCHTLLPRENFYPRGRQALPTHPDMWRGACVKCGDYRQEWASCLVRGKFVDLGADELEALARAERDRVLRMGQGAPTTTTGRRY